MIVTWMLYCSLCALGLSLAATLAERLLLAGRAPVRIVWIGALLLSIGIPLAVFSFASSPTPSLITAASPFESTAPINANANDAAAPSTRSVPSSPASAREWIALAGDRIRDRIRESDSPLLVAWIALSAVLAVSFMSGVIVLAWMRRHWQQRVVQGATVYVSRRTGPAVVGTLSPAIVVPEWALSLTPSQLSLMLRHELEHLRARDGQLLVAAQIALIAMPWNVALWWQVLRLRVAIEMDCDARVLQGADARSYGELLLEVARPHRSFKLAGMIAFAERATQLERRIRVLKRHRVATSKRAMIAASTLALIALSAAWVAPHPVVPPRMNAIATLPSAASLPLVVMRDVPASAPMNIPAARPIAIATRPAGRVARRLACASDTSVVGATYRFLYDGITLARDNESKACQLIARLVDEQLAEDAVAQATELDMRSRRMAVQSERNANLSALLRSDADRATFAANLNRMSDVTARGIGGARSGSGGIIMRAGPPNGSPEPSRLIARGGRGGFVGDSLFVAGTAQDEMRARLERTAAAIALEKGRVEMTMRTTSDSGTINTVTRLTVDTLSAEPERLAQLKRQVETTVAQLNEISTFDYLFKDIQLEPADADLAKTIYSRAQEQMRAVAPPIRPATRLRVNHMRGVAQIVAGADTPLIELAPTAADREKVRSRIVAVP